MSYEPRIPSDPDYVQAAGQAFYNFTYLEWVVVWTIVRLSEDGFDSVPKGKLASYIAKALIRAINNKSSSLSDPLRVRLVKFHERYLEAIRERNKLLHAHPYTAEGGVQQLSGGGRKWPVNKIYEAAKLFEEAAIEGNAIFHGDLAEVRS